MQRFGPSPTPGWRPGLTQGATKLEDDDRGGMNNNPENDRRTNLLSLRRTRPAPTPAPLPARARERFRHVLADDAITLLSAEDPDGQRLLFVHHDGESDLPASIPAEVFGY